MGKAIVIASCHRSKKKKLLKSVPSFKDLLILNYQVPVTHDLNLILFSFRFIKSSSRNTNMTPKSFQRKVTDWSLYNGMHFVQQSFPTSYNASHMEKKSLK